MAQLIIPETAPARLAGPGEPNQPNTSRKDHATEPDSKPRCSGPPSSGVSASARVWCNAIGGRCRPAGARAGPSSVVLRTVTNTSPPTS